MKLIARQKYDYRDLDRGEAQLIRVGHALCADDFDITREWVCPAISPCNFHATFSVNRGINGSRQVFRR